MTRDENLAFLCDVMADKLGLEPELITAEAHLRDELGLDSLDAVELIGYVQDQLGVQVTQEEMETFATVADVLDIMERYDLARAES